VTNKRFLIGFVVFCAIGLVVLITPLSHSITWYNWRYQSHDTDVTSITNGLSHDLGYEEDDKVLYICTNDSGASEPGDWVKITLSATEIADLAHIGDIPTKLSDLSNDAGFIAPVDGVFSLDIDRDGVTSYVVRNENTHVNSASLVSIESDHNDFGLINHSTARTLVRYGLTLGGWNEIFCSPHASFNGLVIGTVAPKPVVFGTNNVERARFSTEGPLQFSSIALLGSPIVGGFEFYNDNLYFTITTGPARETIAFISDIPTLLSELTDDIGAYSVNIELKLLSANHPVVNSAILDTSETVKRLLFRDDSDTEIIWEGRIPNNYNGNALSLVIPYSMSDANIGKYVCITVYVMAVSSGDSQDISVDDYDTINYLSFMVPELAGYLGSVTIVLTNDDGWVAGDYFRIKIGRDTTQTYGTDDATGYFEMLSHPCIIN